MSITETDLVQFGISSEDEGFHAYDPADPTWNESWFWDWFTEDGALAGHCRVGTFPNEHRLWIWLYVWNDGEWLALDQPLLDLVNLQRPTLRYDRWGLEFRWNPIRPLLEGHFRVAGRARAVSGPRVGRMVHATIDLRVMAAGVPHSTGQGNVVGHESDQYDARRFEQPINVSGSQWIDGVERQITGRGERDHSWGPRAWNIEWTFFSLSRREERLQFVNVRIKGFGEPLELGYLQGVRGTQDIASAKLPVAAGEHLSDAFSGRVEIQAEDGTTISGGLEVLTTHEMDISHCLQPPRPTRYHRALVRLLPDDDSLPLLGWLEDNRFLPDDPDAPEF